MKKDTSYFSHDYNARNDVKVLFLRSQLGIEGYGIYWFLVEFLAESGGQLPLKILPVLAMQMQVTEIKVLAVIQSFELFIITEDHFFSERLTEHLELRKILSEKGKEGVRIREEKKIALSNAKSTHSQNFIQPLSIASSNPESNPPREPLSPPSCTPLSKESKVKEIKESKESKENENENFAHTKNSFNQLPLSNDVNELPEIKIGAIIELLKITKNFSVNQKQILGMWSVFKTQNLTGKKFYAVVDDVYSHFFNWIRTQTFIGNEDETKTQQRSKESNLSAIVKQINESERLKTLQANGK